METRFCRHCNTHKLTDQFYYSLKKSGKQAGQHFYDCYCISCKKEISVKRRREMKQRAVEYLGGTCYFCNQKYHYAAFDFHHKDPSKKDFNISRVGISFEKLKAELDKCLLACSNCHRIYHHGDEDAII